MALQSPGVQVTVIDESFYTPAAPGTTPLIVIATAENKTNAAGTGTAAGTLAANIGRAFRITSQRELVETYGLPFFEQAVGGSPIHGGERNEYGLLSAYSMLGITNSIFVVRAGIDLNALQGTTVAPGAEPRDGAWWFDTRATAWGIQEWNSAPRDTVGGQQFTNKTPIVLTDADSARIDSNNAPKSSVGSIGDYAVVAETISSGDSSKEYVRVYYKSPLIAGVGGSAGTWVLVGSEDWFLSIPAAIGDNLGPGKEFDAGTFSINDNVVQVEEDDTLDDVIQTINAIVETQGIVARNVNNRLFLYSDGSLDSVGDSSKSNAIVVADGSLQVSEFGLDAKTYYGPAVQHSPHTRVPSWRIGDSEPRPTGSVWIKTTEPNNGARWRVRRWSSAQRAWVDFSAPLYANSHSALFFLDRTGGGQNIPGNTLFVQYNAEENSEFSQTAEFRIWRRASTAETAILSAKVVAQFTPVQTYSFTIRESLAGQQNLSDVVEIEFEGGTTTSAETIAAAINSAGLLQVEAEVTDDNEVLIYHKSGGDFRLNDGAGTPLEKLGFEGTDFVSGSGTANLYEIGNDLVASNWTPLAVRNFSASAAAPLDEPQDGQLWYNPNFGEVDIMVHDGSTWRGYGELFSSPVGPAIVSASDPSEPGPDWAESRDGQLWISTADLENFPIIYRWNGFDLRWDLVDKTDQTTESGVLFADARYGTAGKNVATSIEELFNSNFLDPDAPDPDLYPRGMLLWNTRRSGGNVKSYARNYIDPTADNPRLGGVAMTGYDTDRWVTASPNNEDGSGSFGRKAQRSVVVQTLKSVVDTSEEIRDEERRNFNLIACPGYPELLSNLVNLNIDRGITSFVIGDTPFRLRSDATSLTTWATNQNGAFDNGDDGLVTFDEYAGIYYPNGFTTDLGGANVVVPASHMMLRTIALSDQVSYPWFAPAGTRRGGITNATSVGFIDASTGEFRTVALNNGQRDTLYDLKVNPIPFFVGVGHVAYGQKTLAREASALDRINVARLVVYLRSQLNRLARPYIFEPNDKITRDEIKSAVESLLLELVGLRALNDFAVVCDESNNTPSRVDRNELYVDIAIEPVKAVEFIYIPLRIQNTGEI